MRPRRSSDVAGVAEWKHASTVNPRTPTVETWEHWPDPEWRWHVARSVPREPRHKLGEIVNERSPPEEHWTWSVAFQEGDFERWHGADQWLVGGVCFSEAEAKETCERTGPRIYELWALTRPRKH